MRRAVHLAVSRQNLIQAFGTQEVINLTRWVPYGDAYATPPEEIAQLPGYREDKTEDIETAKALLAEAGFADGIPMLKFWRQQAHKQSSWPQPSKKCCSAI